MSCDVTKFVISKGSDNTFTFTIKQNESTLAMVIEAGDTFFATLVLLDGDVPYPQISDKALTVVSAANGEVSLNIPEADTANLVIERGSKVDRYYNRPTYKLVLDCNTANNGPFIAKVAEVYVD